MPQFWSLQRLAGVDIKYSAMVNFHQPKRKFIGRPKSAEVQKPNSSVTCTYLHFFHYWR
jgi:hypothetical protein